MRNRRAAVSISFLLASVGLMGLYRVTSEPRFDQLRTVDVVQLIGTGMCFGAALVMLGMFLFDRGRRSN